ncbi:hypothetical protein V5O48_002437 [Marasmius crinis-equi]|uniref:Uncharacterized protein n=1 Tax=Marasmius crinis-equi TaxID=585013 RepID=A0ABR3FWD6_9AGAR
MAREARNVVGAMVLLAALDLEVAAESVVEVQTYGHIEDSNLSPGSLTSINKRAELAEKGLECASVQAQDLKAELSKLGVELQAMKDTAAIVQGELTQAQAAEADAEKELVSLLMKTTQAMHEQDMVEEENDLWRHDNMIGSLQAKIDTLESTLAKCWKNQGQGHEQESQSKLMVDLNIWMSNSPLTDPASVESLYSVMFPAFTVFL